MTIRLMSRKTPEKERVYERVKRICTNESQSINAGDCRVNDDNDDGDDDDDVLCVEGGGDWDQR